MGMRCIIFGIGLISNSVAAAENWTVVQVDRLFKANGTQISELSVSVGDTINFTNLDPIFHSVYSTSSAQEFDLGNFFYGMSGSVTFTQPGEVEVACSFHPEMFLVVNVNE